MDLSRSLIKDFADVTSEQKTTNPSDSYVRGTARVQGEQKYVQIDGSDQLTPILETVDVQEGDRVLVSIKNHTATILGNFTFPPNARKEDEALDKAEDAGNTANEASQKAQESYDKANEASSAASDAKTHADAAKQAADQAQAAADEAKTSSEEAKTSAGSAIDKANEAYGKAQDAQDSVSEANNEISRINTEVNGVKDDIDSALTDLGNLAQETETIKSTMEVNYAKKTELSDVEASLKSEIVRSVGELQATISETYAAKSDVVSLEGKLQTQITQNAEGIASQASKVEKLEADTEAAQQAVNEAKQSATNAQNAANEALENAATAQENADSAAQAAKDAKEKADKASEEALNAAMDARVADEALTAARTALNEARKHYESVINNPSSTAEEIEQAQAAVDEAIQNVNDALAAAATAAYAAEKAQEAANQASLDAETAQGVANDAQQKADSAKEVADNAQKAAQKAQEDVAALTKRVTTAETNISQNAEQIALTASKTDEIGDLLQNDYYSKTQTDAAIKVSADSIKQEVSETYSEKTTVITGTKEEFYLSNSPTSLTGGAWSDTQPNWTEGKYIWRRTQLTKGDGTTMYTPSKNGVCITGNTGSAGEPGEDGKDGTSVTITKTEITYKGSTSGTTPPSGTWSTAIPTVPAGQYLWTKTVVTYSDGKSTTAYSVSRIGTDGSDGSDGRDGTSVTITDTSVTYQKSTSGTTPPTGSWTTTIPATSAGEYLWTKTVVTYSDGTSTTSHSVSRNGSNGAAGKGIKSVTNYYLASASGSGVTTDTSGWTTTVQNISSSKKYLWNYEKITYTDNSTTSTTPCIIGTYGRDGTDGAAGEDGVGISSIQEYYQVSSSGTTAPSSWVTTPPTMTASKKYLWNYEKITYTNSTTKETAKRVIGVYGDKGQNGEDGVGVKSSSVTYQASTSGTTVPTGAWTQTIPSVAANQYLWTKTTITYTDGKTSTAYSVGKMGANGSPGSTGRGIQSITTEFYLSTSKTTQTGGSWTTAMPNWTSGKYLWTRSKIVYKNPSGTEYTAPVCDSSWEAVNEIEVGGRNLAERTNNGKSGWYWTMRTGDYTAEDYIVNGVNGVKLKRGDVAQSDWSVIFYNYIKPKKYEANTEYTVSFDCLAYSAFRFNVSFRENSSGNAMTNTVKTSPTVSNQWTKVTATLKTLATLPEEIGSQVLYLTNMPSDVGKAYYFKNLMIEKGNKASDWSPAPEDLQDYTDSQISSAAQTITEQYKTLIDQTADQINLMVDQLRSVTNSQSTSIASISNKLELTSQMAQFVKTTTEQLRDAVNGKLSAQEVQEWARFDGANLELGASNSPFKCRLSTTELAFYQGANKVAWISNNELNILTAIIAKSIGCGNFTFVDEGNLGFSLI